MRKGIENVLYPISYTISIMDVLYYSNYCKHSQKVIQTLVKNNVIDQISCICIDKRSRDQQTNQIYIHLENGEKMVMPPNLHNVPALLLTKQNYQFIHGDEIVKHFHKDIVTKNERATNFNGEPAGYHLGKSTTGSNIMSEKFTYYNMTPDELSAKGISQRRQLYNYVSTQDDSLFIPTPADSYHSDKIEGDLTIDKLQQLRLDEMNKFAPKQLPAGERLFS